MLPSGRGQSTSLLVEIIALLDKQKIPYAIIGALAAAYYGVVRASLDADAVISLGRERAVIDSFLNSLRELGIDAQIREGDVFDPISGVIVVSDSFENRVDLLLGIRGFEPAAFSRTRQTSISSVKVHIVGLEDFIAMKIFAGSALDLQDARGALEEARNVLDRDLLKRLTSAYGEEHLKILEQLLPK